MFASVFAAGVRERERARPTGPDKLTHSDPGDYEDNEDEESNSSVCCAATNTRSRSGTVAGPLAF